MVGRFLTSLETRPSDCCQCSFSITQLSPYGCKTFDSYSHLVTIGKIGFFVRLLRSIILLRRQARNYSLLHGAAMVMVRSSLFVHHSDSSTPTFWRRDFSPNERDAESVSGVT